MNGVLITRQLYDKISALIIFSKLFMKRCRFYRETASAALRTMLML